MSVVLSACALIDSVTPVAHAYFLSKLYPDLSDLSLSAEKDAYWFFNQHLISQIYRALNLFGEFLYFAIFCGEFLLGTFVEQRSYIYCLPSFLLFCISVFCCCCVWYCYSVNLEVLLFICMITVPWQMTACGFYRRPLIEVLETCYANVLLVLEWFYYLKEFKEKPGWSFSISVQLPLICSHVSGAL